jgi:beta-lactamase regulating signal transducer with metallopeptidase domain
MWFHPAVRTLTSRVALARETMVDELSLQLTRDRRAYAEALLAFSEPQPRLVGVTPLVGRHLRQRISLIFKEESMSHRRTLLVAIVALVVSGTATALAAVTIPITEQRQDSRVYKPGNGVKSPAVVSEVKPVYTPEAMQKRRSRPRPDGRGGSPRG